MTQQVTSPAETPATSSSSVHVCASSAMGSLLQCIRSCLDSDDDQPSEPPPIEHVAIMDRAYVTESTREQPPECCNIAPPPWTQFWQNLQKQSYHHLEADPQGYQSPLSRSGDSLQSVRKCSSCGSVNKSPLRTAETFDSSRDILTIRMEEIVLPGSALQHAMALKMCESIQQQAGDECVICMESFSLDNPRMPTLCGCGANKTYFHLPCLYQWREQSQDCPSCRQRITWEEF